MLGEESDVFVGNSLIDMYLKCGSVEDGSKVFKTMISKDFVSWNAMIVGHSQNGCGEEDIDLFKRMLDSGEETFKCSGTFLGLKTIHFKLIPKSEARDAVVDQMLISPELLRSCTTPRSIRQLHPLLLKSGASSLFHANCLLQMYCRAGSPADAQRLFEEMPLRNTFSWNSLLRSFADSGDVGKSVSIFSSIPCKNSFSYNALIRGLTRSCRAADLLLARKVFDEMPLKNAVALNCVMHAYVRSGCPSRALGLYRDANSEGSSPIDDGFVFATALNACAQVGAYGCGRQVHSRMIVCNFVFDAVSTSALVDMYGKCGDLDNAVRLFQRIPEPDDFTVSAIVTCLVSSGRWEDARMLVNFEGSSSGVALWNSMLSGCVSNGRDEEALEVFKEMSRSGCRADSSSLTSALRACTELGAVENGKHVHCLSWKLGVAEDVVVGTALVDFYSTSSLFDNACKAFSDLKSPDTVALNAMIHVYSSCGRIQEARRVFDGISDRSLISWNSMIVGYSQNGCADEAIMLFIEMHQLDLRVDNVTFATVLSACAGISSLRFGEQVFALATVAGLESDHIVSTSLVDLYCKCGKVGFGRKVFEGMRRSDDAPWNSMLMGYATNGCGIEALNLFSDMRIANVKLSEVSFIGVLTACCHCGLVEEGRKLFHEMKDKYNVSSVMEHYSCLVDLLARGGRLREALEFIDTMPVPADIGIWTSLLRECVVQGNEPLGREVAERLIQLDPKQPGHYVQLAGIYATHGKWEKSEHIRKEMREKGVAKAPGCSWMDE